MSLKGKATFEIRPRLFCTSSYIAASLSSFSNCFLLSLYNFPQDYVVDACALQKWAFQFMNSRKKTIARRKSSSRYATHLTDYTGSLVPPLNSLGCRLSPLASRLSLSSSAPLSFLLSGSQRAVFYCDSLFLPLWLWHSRQKKIDISILQFFFSLTEFDFWNFSFLFVNVNKNDMKSPNIWTIVTKCLALFQSNWNRS